MASGSPKARHRGVTEGPQAKSAQRDQVIMTRSSAFPSSGSCASSREATMPKSSKSATSAMAEAP